jgi:four helix bundle protein
VAREGVVDKEEEKNIEHPTSNIQHRSGSSEGRVFDLEERLLEYAARVVRLAERLPRTRAGSHVAKQFLKSGTSPLPNHGEAQAAESPEDFRHKLRICLKEFRETLRWLRLIGRVPLVRQRQDLDEVAALSVETDELIRIFVKSIRTSEARQRTRSGRDFPK